MSKNSGRNRVEVSGIVTAFDWDDNDDVTRISLSVDDEEEYLIDDDGTGKELLEWIRAEVRILGSAYLDENGNLCLKVKKYTVL